MGQYQQDDLDLKYTTLELAHRNSQASVPFVLSSLGYGFLWHNPSYWSGYIWKKMWQTGMQQAPSRWIIGLQPEIPLMKLSKHMDELLELHQWCQNMDLAFWQCKLRYWNQEQLLSVARKYHEKKIPSRCDCMWFLPLAKNGWFPIWRRILPRSWCHG